MTTEITITEIVQSGTYDDALACLERCSLRGVSQQDGNPWWRWTLGVVYSTDDKPLQVTDDYGNALTAQEAIDAIRARLDAIGERS